MSDYCEHDPVGRSIEEMGREIEALRAKLDNESSRHEGCQRALTRVMAELTESCAETQRLREEALELKAEVAMQDQPTTVKALEQREEMFQIAKGYEERIEELESENVQLKQGYTAVRNDMSRVSKAAKEVEQENRDISQQMDRLCDDNVKLSDEYDDLQKMFTAAAAHAEELELGAEELNNQIEDLEKYKERAAEIFVEKDKRIIAIWEDHGYKIPTDQIRKAWAYARSLPAGSEGRISICYALRLLPIVRCGGGGGDGRATSSHAAKAEQTRHGTCPDCNGEGFVIGGEDE